MYLKKLKQPAGFTLIEVLIVVMVIAVLGGIVLSLINSSGIRQKARDSQRIADLKKIQTALELYFADNRQYPVSAGGDWELVSNSSGILSSALDNYLAVIPTDPVSGGTSSTPCAGGTTPRYNYRSHPQGYSYVLTAIMEVATSDDTSTCASLSNWNSGPNLGCTVPAGVNCYGAQNP